MYNAGYYKGRGDSFNRKRIEEIRNRTAEARNEKARENMEELRRQKAQREAMEEQQQLVDRIMRENNPQKRVDDIVQAISICKEASVHTKVDETVAAELAKQ